MAIRKRYGSYGKIGPARGFTWGEVRCTDGSLNLSATFRRRYRKQGKNLNRLRKIIKADHPNAVRIAITVNSWYRSPSYNASIGGATFSQHVVGRATDIRVFVVKRDGTTQIDPAKVGEYATRVKAFRQGGIGVYDRKNGNFTHVDHRPDGPARWTNG